MKLAKYKSIVSTFVICLLMVVTAHSQIANDNWHGFKKQSFKVDTASAYIVIPEKPMAGNPWLWRTYSPEFHEEIDSILVTKGFHIGFININFRENNLFCNTHGPVTSTIKTLNFQTLEITNTRKCNRNQSV